MLNWFEGIGGFRYGLEKANKQDSQIWETSVAAGVRPTGNLADTDGVLGRPEVASRNASADNSCFKCVGACEIDRYARSVYAHNFGHEPEWADSLTVDVQSLPDHDLFTAGVPCQAWSVAGKRKGFEDARGTMWFECFRIIQAKQPKFVLLENVKGILSHNGGASFERICECICDLGYAIDFEVLNSKDFGVPQNRERVFIIGIRLDLLDSCQVF